MSEIIVETKTCRHCAQQFSVTQGDLDFYAKISPIFGGQKFDIPTPTLCPACRQRRRLAFRNERNLYRRTCDASGKQIISMYRPDCGYKVYDQKIRRSDSWDPIEYGKEFDFSKTFIEQFDVLMHEAPHMSLSSNNCEGCEYANFVLDSKQCYLLYGGGYDEMVMYGDFVNNSSYCFDCSFCSDNEQCFECINCQGCFGCLYSINCTNSSTLIGCTDCDSCSFCIQSSGLTNASYCIANTQVSKEAYIQHIATISLGTALYQRSSDLHLIGCEGCSGKNIITSKHCISCADITESESLKYCAFVPKATCCHDLDFMAPFGSSYSYELCSSTGTTFSLSTYLTRLSSSMYYCYECKSCTNCFGSIGLRNKSYCIFNKQYTKDEYEITVAKIISHMQETPLKTEHASERGEFFHPSLSPFGYNETVAQEYYPCSVIARSPNEVSGDVAIYSAKQDPSTSSGGPLINYESFGYKRSNYEAPRPVSEKVIKGQDLPNDIEEVDDSILQYAIECAVTGKLFRIQPQELVFYRKHGITLPRKHPDQRHLERLALRK